MYIPELHLKKYPKFVIDEICARGCDNIRCLSEKHNRALELNEKEGHVPEFVAETDGDGYDNEWINIYFTYYRKLDKKDIKQIDSYNYRMIETYNKFINENPKVAEALDMKIQKT